MEVVERGVTAIPEAVDGVPLTTLGLGLGPAAAGVEVWRDIAPENIVWIVQFYIIMPAKQYGSHDILQMYTVVTYKWEMQNK